SLEPLVELAEVLLHLLDDLEVHGGEPRPERRRARGTRPRDATSQLPPIFGFVPPVPGGGGGGGGGGAIVVVAGGGGGGATVIVVAGGDRRGGRGRRRGARAHREIEARAEEPDRADREDGDEHPVAAATRTRGVGRSRERRGGRGHVRHTGRHVHRRHRLHRL